jgi:hypothetical protein
MTQDELKKHIAAFLSDYSIEITPHDAERLDAIRAELKEGTAVYVAHPPGVPIDDIVTLAGRVQKLGLKATPHVIARKLESREQLERALARCQELGIKNALCVAGDITADKPAYDSSLEVLETGLFAKYGFRAVGVAGHPEGSKAIGAERVEQALRGKIEFAKTAPFELYFATQFGFDPQPFIDWEARFVAAAREVRDALRRRRVDAHVDDAHERDGQPAEHSGARRDGHGARAAQGRKPAVAVQEGPFLRLRRGREDRALGQCCDLWAVRLEQPGNWFPR